MAYEIQQVIAQPAFIERTEELLQSAEQGTPSAEAAQQNANEVISALGSLSIEPPLSDEQRQAYEQRASVAANLNGQIIEAKRETQESRERQGGRKQRRRFSGRGSSSKGY